VAKLNTSTQHTDTDGKNTDTDGKHANGKKIGRPRGVKSIGIKDMGSDGDIDIFD